MSEALPTAADPPTNFRLAAGEDRFGEQRGLGISSITFKVSGQESNGLFILENTFHGKGGPGRHLHYEQDEWFYALEGEFIFEVGTERSRLNPGDSLFVPRRVPHVWASVAGGGGRILVAFAPAGSMETFFREASQANTMPAQDSTWWRAHGMELLGPPLAID